MCSPVEFHNGDLAHRGDRRVGISYVLHNYQGRYASNARQPLESIGTWTPCDVGACNFSARWVAHNGTRPIFSTALAGEPYAPPPDYLPEACEASDEYAVEVDRECARDGSGREAAFRVLRPRYCLPRPPAHIECAYVLWAEPMSLVAYVGVACCVLVKVLLAAQLGRRRGGGPTAPAHTKRDATMERAVRRLQPPLCLLMLAGGILLDLSTLLLLGVPSDALCLLRPSATLFSFTAFFAPFGFRMLRVRTLLGEAPGKDGTFGDTKRTATPRTPGPSRRKHRRFSGLGHVLLQYTLLLIVLLALMSVLLALFTPTAAMRAHPYYASDEGLGFQVLVDDQVCHYPLGLTLSFSALLGALLLASLGIALRTRRAFEEFNYSRTAIFATVLVVFAVCVLIPLQVRHHPPHSGRPLGTFGRRSGRCSGWLLWDGRSDSQRKHAFSARNYRPPKALGTLSRTRKGSEPFSVRNSPSSPLVPPRGRCATCRASPRASAPTQRSSSSRP